MSSHSSNTADQLYLGLYQSSPGQAKAFIALSPRLALLRTLPVQPHTGPGLYSTQPQASGGTIRHQAGPAGTKNRPKVREVSRFLSFSAENATPHTLWAFFG